ncbi:hypothetical protein ACIP1T_21355 [Pseudomonas japonica]|uniref:hypothetical protein n=1 Tax=Pseudomonas japonica TaxID=256466 RepID=UPI003819AAE2
MSKEISFPDDYGHVRIGSTIDYLTRELAPTMRAFEMGKLKTLGLLTSNTPVARMTTIANTFGTADASSWSTSVDAKLKVKSLICNTELGFHTDQAAGDASTSSGMTLDVIYEVSGLEIVLLQNATAEQLYQCSTDKFQQDYKAITEAADIYQWLEAQQKFRMNFGDGFVSKIKLTSFASGSLEFSYRSHQESSSQKWGGSFSINGPFSAASASAEYARSVNSARSGGELRSSAFGLPADSPALNWVKSVIDNYTGKGIDVLLAAPPENITYPSTSAKAPDISLVPLPSKPPVLPEMKLRISNAKDLVDYLKVKNHLEQNGGTVDSLETFMGFDQSKRARQVEDAQQDLQKSLGSARASHIAADAFALGHKDAALPASASFASSSAPPSGERAGNEQGAADDFDLGGYAVSGMEFSRYEDFFPALRIRTDMLTQTGINVVKEQTFVMMQQLIAQYLNYIKDLPQAIRGSALDGANAGKFANLVKTYATTSRNAIKASMLDAQGFTSTRLDNLHRGFFASLKAEFGNMVDERNKQDPDLYILNRYFLEHFELLSKAPFGFALNVHNDHIPYGDALPSKYFHLLHDDQTPFLQRNLPFPVRRLQPTTVSVDKTFLAEKCQRFIPVIRVIDKQPKFVMATYFNNLYPASYLSGSDATCIGQPGGGPAVPAPPVTATAGWAVIAHLEIFGSPSYQTYTIAPLEYVIGSGYRTSIAWEELMPALSDDLSPDEALTEMNVPEGYVFGGIGFCVENPGAADTVLNMARQARVVNGKYGQNCNIGFIPVGYDTARSCTVQGIPMWRELPFEALELAARGIY